MCGITGFIGKEDPGLLIRMMDSLVHRGPDEAGLFSDGIVNLGIRRLSIVDLETGSQPMCSENEKIWVVSNGEIYNHRELREDLLQKGHRFKTDHADTEVIVHLYEEYAEEWPTRVNGMFGAALWDQNKKQLMLCRDRIGKKPLYYSCINGVLTFASEIKAILLHPGVSRALNYRALYHYFGLKHICAPDTSFSDIHQVLPGHLVLWRDGEITTRPYWTIDFSAAPLGKITEKEAADHLMELLGDAVKIRMMCDVPFGAYLSGGVDSSSVVAAMAEYHAYPLKTFCLGYVDEPEGQFCGKAQDLFYSRKISKRFGTDHYEYIMGADEFAERMPEILSSFDEPFSGVVSTYFLTNLIKEHVKVALSGDGADELFGSYLAHRLAFPIQKYLSLRIKGQKDWKDLNPQEKAALKPFDTPDQFRFLQSIASEDIALWRSRLSVFTDEEKGLLLTGDFLEKAGHPVLQSIYKTLDPNLTAKDVLNRCLEIDQHDLLPNEVLPFVDRLSMAHSVEVRSPFLDYRIVEFVNRLPGGIKIKNGSVKYILKKAAEKILPTDIVQRPKEGFVQPIYSWMHGQLREWVGSWLSTLPKEIFDLSYVKSLQRGFESGDRSFDAKIWNLTCFAIWYKQFFSSKP